MEIVIPEIESNIPLGLDGQSDILQYGERKEDIRKLERPSNTQFGSKSRRQGSDILSFKKDFPFSWTVLSGDHIEEGGLSRSIRSDNRLESKRKDLGVYMIDGDMTTEANSKVLRFDEWVLVHRGKE
jgi:hypothetical protein